jgi:hypothetical protein
MNRIRKKNYKYQVLLTPDLKSAPSYEVLLDNWLDTNLQNFNIVEYDTLSDAQAEAFKHPDIDWYKLVLTHENIYVKLNQQIRQIIQNNNLVIDYHSVLMKPLEIKDIMFDRIIAGGERFTLTWDLNDVIGFHLVNPWSSNLSYTADLLQADPTLRIFSRNTKDKVIRLTGRTDIGTTYEIKLWPSLLANFARWVGKNKQNQGVINNAPKIFSDMLKTQDVVDLTTAVR